MNILNSPYLAMFTIAAFIALAHYSYTTIQPPTYTPEDRQSMRELTIRSLASYKPTRAQRNTLTRAERDASIVYLWAEDGK